MIHNISTILDSSLQMHERFLGHTLNLVDDYGSVKTKKTLDVIPVYSNGDINNYGGLIGSLPDILTRMYVRVNKESDAMITNSNRSKYVAWYIDGKESFTLKENLPYVSSYAISETSETSETKFWISKPSHRYVGSGKYILVSDDKEKLERRPKTVFHGEILHWIVQPLLTDIILWNSLYKFDLRIFAVVYNQGDSFHGASYKICFGRRCVNPHDPKNDISSVITNISYQEKIYGYDSEFNLPLIYDDISVGKSIVKDFLSKSELVRDKRKQIQILILGLDVIFLNDGTPKLIEVNHGPALEYQIDNNEKVASLGFALGLFGYIIPNLLNRSKITSLKDWDFIN